MGSTPRKRVECYRSHLDVEAENLVGKWSQRGEGSLGMLKRTLFFRFDLSKM